MSNYILTRNKSKQNIGKQFQLTSNYILIYIKISAAHKGSRLKYTSEALFGQKSKTPQ